MEMWGRFSCDANLWFKWAETLTAVSECLFPAHALDKSEYRAAH